MARWQWSAFVLSVMCVLGCSSETPQPESQLVDTSKVLSQSEDSDAASANKTDEGGKKTESSIPNLAKIKAQMSAPKRETLAGRWIFGGLQIIPGDGKNTPPQYGENTELIVTVQLNDAEPSASTVSITAARDGVTKRQLKLIALQGQTITFECTDAESGKKVFDYSGKLIAGNIIGSLVTPNGEMSVVRLAPTEERTFARIPGFRPFEEQQAFMELAQSAVPEEDIKAISKQYPTSPMLKVALVGIFEQMVPRSLPKEELDKFINEMLKAHELWGPTAKALLLLDVNARLILSGYDDDYIEKWIEASAVACDEAGLKSEGSQRRITGLRDIVKLRRCIRGLEGKTVEERDAGRKLAAEVLQKNAFNAAVQWKLADSNREDKHLDDALRQFAELAIFPMQEAILKNAWARERAPVQNTPPTERVAQLWKEKHGKADGLDQYLEQVYDESLLSFTGEPVTKREKEDSTRVVLAEFFVGVRCDQSICADVALSGLQKVFPTSMLIALRYHQHNPGHDPLATEEGEARLYNFYRGQGTPTVSLNGHDVQQAGGVLLRMNEVFPALKQAVLAELAKPTTIKVEVTAKRAGDDIKINATADGEGLTSGSKRLRVVLAESGIKYAAPNGIRRHDMIVRQMVAGEEGVPVADGKLAFDGQTNVAKLKAAHSEYLDRFGKNQKVEFPNKPLDFQNLSVVAWVQDDVTREILQAAVVTVE